MHFNRKEMDQMPCSQMLCCEKRLKLEMLSVHNMRRQLKIL